MVLTLELFLPLVLSAIYLYFYQEVDPNRKPKNTPQDEVKEEYDFIIVGAGAAGCAVARRLTEVPEWSVAIVEAGGNENAASNVPLFWPFLLGSELDFKFKTVPQTRTCQDSNGICAYPSGRVMGGSSSIGAMNFLRGHRTDFDEWESLGNSGWGYKYVLKYYKKLERVVERSLISNYRGTKGPMNIQFSRYKTKMREEYIRAGQELGLNKTDLNGRRQENAIGYNQMTAIGPSRQSTSKAYLAPIRNRNNLAIIQKSFVIKILIRNKVATGVEYIRDGKKYAIKARKEVILCAGTLNSPKLLMLSGIGPRNELEKYGIKLLSNLPVGRYLYDNVGFQIFFELKNSSTITPENWRNNKTALEYGRFRKGPLTWNGVDAIILRNNDNTLSPPNVLYLIYGTQINQTGPDFKDLMYFFVVPLRPETSGSLKLRSDDPFADPLIDPNFLASNNDYEKFRKGAEWVFEYMDTSIMKKYSPKHYTANQPKCSGLSRKNYIKCAIEQYSLSFYNPIGTVKMGPTDDPTAVVNSELLVKEFANLRVIDASIMPCSLKSNTLATAIMIGEKGADIIKMKYFPDEFREFLPTSSPLLVNLNSSSDSGKERNLAPNILVKS